MRSEHIVGKSKITDEEVEKQINELLDILKSKKQTYAVDKFVLERAIEELSEIIV